MYGVRPIQYMGEATRESEAVWCSPKVHGPSWARPGGVCAGRPLWRLMKSGLYWSCLLPLLCLTLHTSPLDVLMRPHRLQSSLVSGADIPSRHDQCDVGGQLQGM